MFGFEFRVSTSKFRLSIFEFRVSTSRVQQDFAEELPAFHFPLGGCGLPERESGINHGFDLPRAMNLRASSSSAFPPIKEPRIVHWRPNKPCRLSFTSPPLVTPQVTNRP